MTPRRRSTVVLVALLAAGCTPTDTPPNPVETSETVESPSPSASVVTSSPSPTPTPTPSSEPEPEALPKARDGARYEACRDAKCQVRVHTGSVLTIDHPDGQIVFRVEVVGATVMMSDGEYTFTVGAPGGISYGDELEIDIEAFDDEAVVTINPA